MAKLGSFEVAKKTIRQVEGTSEPQEPDTFDFCGEEFRVADDDTAPLVPLMELADAYQSSGDDSYSMEALAATWQMLKYCIHDADWPRFRGLAMRKKADLDDLMPVMLFLWEVVTSRPSPGPSASPDGPSKTSTSSKAASPSGTGQRSSYTVDLPDADPPSAPDFAHLTAANEWTPPPGHLAQVRPDLAEMDRQMVSVEELLAGAT